jgi:surface polysaccharide O-acyltransferase-like enzyme
MDGNAPTRTVAAVAYIDYLDLMKCYALILVLMVHVSAAGSYLWGSVPGRSWWMATAYGSFARTCVPLFLMASGATLLDRTKIEPIGRFLARRTRRILVPLLIWSTVYQLDRAFIVGQTLTPVSVLRDLLLGTSFYHLPFFYYLFGLYLCTPVLAHFADRASTAATAYFVILWFLVSCQALASDLSGYPVGVPVFVVMGFAGYFVSGRLLRDVALCGRAAGICAALVLSMTVLTLVGTFYLTRKAGNLDQMLFEYGRPNTVAMSVGTFLVLSSAPVRRWLAAHPKARLTLGRGGGFCFGIFLVHPLLLQIVMPWIGLNWMTFGAPIGIPLSLFVLLALSTLVVWILGRSPWLREVVP